MDISGCGAFLALVLIAFLVIALIFGGIKVGDWWSGIEDSRASAAAADAAARSAASYNERMTEEAKAAAREAEANAAAAAASAKAEAEAKAAAAQAQARVDMQLAINELERIRGKNEIEKMIASEDVYERRMGLIAVLMGIRAGELGDKDVDRMLRLYNADDAISQETDRAPVRNFGQRVVDRVVTIATASVAAPVAAAVLVFVVGMILWIRRESRKMGSW